MVLNNWNTASVRWERLSLKMSVLTPQPQGRKEPLWLRVAMELKLWLPVMIHEGVSRRWRAGMDRSDEKGLAVKLFNSRSARIG